MNEDQLREYIELQRQLIEIMRKNKKGWTMEEFEAIRKIEQFEDSLDCNK
jgi:hypothetical protein